MPWLIRDNDKEASENLLFVHVPRCGGTSLMSHFDVPKKSLKGRSFLGKLSLRYFFHRYSLLQKANFPVSSGESVVAFVLISIGIGCMKLLDYQKEGGLADPRRIGSIVTIIIGVIIFLYSAFWATAPTIGRVDRIRQNNLVLVKYLNMASIEWLTGINPHGYVPHLTAQKLLAYGYVSPKELESVCSMAIVRNPYARMISMYMWNRVWLGSDSFGAGESFSTFVKSWYKLMRHYRERREMEEYYTPCHCIPQYEYTHSNNGEKQIVQSVIKQEELKYLNNNNNEQANQQDGSSNLTVNNLPKPVRDALVGMPKINGRTTTKKWYEYYDQETLNLTYELYHKDFEVFGYSPKLEQRPDLDKPAVSAVNMLSPMSKNNNNTPYKEEMRHSNNSLTCTKEDNTTSPSTTKDLRTRTSSSSSMSLYCVGFEKEMIFEFNLI